MNVERDEDDLPTTVDRFQILRRRQTYVLVLVIPCVTALALLKAFPNQLPVELAIIIVVIALTIIFSSAAFSFWNWRCPVCRKWLGNNYSIRLCPHCRAIFQNEVADRFN